MTIQKQKLIQIIIYIYTSHKGYILWSAYFPKCLAPLRVYLSPFTIQRLKLLYIFRLSPCWPICKSFGKGVRFNIAISVFK